MRKQIGFALILLLVLVGSPASANKDTEIITVEKGEVAPFSGDLFPPALSLSLGLRVERCEAEKEADAVRITRLHEIELGAERVKFAIRNRGNEEMIELLQSALATKETWYRQPEFVAAVTAVLMSAAFAGSLYAYDALAGDFR